MIFLQDNVLLKRDLKHEDIKPRLLGRPFSRSVTGEVLSLMRHFKVIGAHALG